MNQHDDARTRAAIEALAADWCTLLRAELDRMNAGRTALRHLRTALIHRDAQTLESAVSHAVTNGQSGSELEACHTLLARTASVLRVAPDNVKLAMLADRCSENARRRLLDLRQAVKSAAVESRSLARGNEALIGQARSLYSQLLAALGQAEEQSERYDASGRRQSPTVTTVLETQC